MKRGVTTPSPGTIILKWIRITNFRDEEHDHSGSQCGRNLGRKSGLSTFANPPVEAKDVLDALRSNKAVVKIPANAAPPEELEVVKTQGGTGNVFLDANHWELQASQLLQNLTPEELVTQRWR
jgi:hypothetical protein